MARQTLSMRKIWRLFLVVGLSACSGQQSNTTDFAQNKHAVSPEADPKAPGMIPYNCETLLQKSKEWGYIPGKKWKPQNLDQAKDVAAYFSEFTIVPESSSSFWTSWINQDTSSDENSAAKTVNDLAKVQVCDIELTNTFFEGMAKFAWRTERNLAKKSAFKFFLNQQARSGPIVMRALTVKLLSDAHRAGLIRVSQNDLARIQKKSDQAREQLNYQAITAKTSMEVESNYRKELLLSEQLREDIAKILPLPE